MLGAPGPLAANIDTWSEFFDKRTIIGGWELLMVLSSLTEIRLVDICTCRLLKPLAPHGPSGFEDNKEQKRPHRRLNYCYFE